MQKKQGEAPRKCVSSSTSCNEGPLQCFFCQRPERQHHRRVWLQLAVSSSLLRAPWRVFEDSSLVYYHRSPDCSDCSSSKALVERQAHSLTVEVEQVPALPRPPPPMPKPLAKVKAAAASLLQGRHLVTQHGVITHFPADGRVQLPAKRMHPWLIQPIGIQLTHG